MFLATMFGVSCRVIFFGTMYLKHCCAQVGGELGRGWLGRVALSGVPSVAQGYPSYPVLMAFGAARHQSQGTASALKGPQHKTLSSSSSEPSTAAARAASAAAKANFFRCVSLENLGDVDSYDLICTQSGLKKKSTENKRPEV